MADGALGRTRRDPVGNDWLALLLEPADERHDTGHARSGRTAWPQHGEFGKAAGDHILGGAPLHPPTTATTVKVRDGETILTDGPYVEGAEVANGFYLLRATDRDEAVKLASMIPASAVELRQLAGISGLYAGDATWTASSGGNGVRPSRRSRAGAAT